MNYIKQLQADKAAALYSARSIETEINDLVSYLSCDKFRVGTRVQVDDVLGVQLLAKILLSTLLQPFLTPPLTIKIAVATKCDMSHT